MQLVHGPTIRAPTRFFDLAVTDADVVENVDTWTVEYYYKLHSTVDTGLSAWTLVND